MATINATASAHRIKGGSFLIEPRQPQDVFTPEDFSSEHRQVAKTATDFVNNEVMPVAAEIESKNFAVTRSLLAKAGELGLLSADVPEEYGGMAMDKVTSALIAECISKLGSFSVAFGAHVGIGTLPIVWYGTGEQKQKYLPKLATGEWIAAYALSESSSGSDALNCRARAVLSPDGKEWVLNGEKMWISNSGFADLMARSFRRSWSSARPPASRWAPRSTSSASAAPPPARSSSAIAAFPSRTCWAKLARGTTSHSTS
jgi:alkylation response protein AidB-like acyl-CoA dehydrogenase